MHPLLVAMVMGALWALLRFLLVPRIEARWQASDLGTKAARAGLLAMLGKLSELTAVAALTLAAVGLLVALASLLGDADATWSQRAVDRFAELHGSVDAFAKGFGKVAAWVAGVGAAIALLLVARAARRRVVGVWRDYASDEHDAMLRDPGIIEAARDDPDLQPLVERIDAIIAHRAVLDRYGGEDPEPRERLDHELAATVTQLAIERARKRVDFPALATAAPAPGEPPPGRWRRLFTTLSSKKLSEDLGLVRKPLGRAVTAFTLVTLIGWSAAPAANSLALGVNNLRMQLVAADAKRDLDQALSRRDLPEPLPSDEGEPEEDEAGTASAAQLVARAIMVEIARADPLARAAGVRRAPSGDTELVRALIAEHTPASDASFERGAALLRREAAGAAGRPVAASGPVENYLAARVTPVMERLRREQPGGYRRLVAAVEARYAAPTAATDALGALTGQVLDAAAGRADLAPTTETGKQAQKLARELGKKALKTWVDAAADTTLAYLLGASARPLVERELALSMRSGSRALVIELATRPAADLAAGPAALAEARTASKVAQEAVERPTGLLLDDATREDARVRLAGYDAVFPSAPGSAASDGMPLPGLPDLRWPQARSPYSSFSFAARSGRARGVVIGRDLPGRLDIRDLRWRLVRPARPGAATRAVVELRMLDPAGRAAWRPAGGFDAGVLNQALRYAADRRVIATTIMGGDGGAIRMVTHLHPALVDTPLGCRVVESDRWIDTFTVRSPSELSRAALPILLDRLRVNSWMSRVNAVEQVAGIAAGSSCPVNSADFASFPGLSADQGRALDVFAARLPGGPPATGVLRVATRCANGSPAASAACLCRQFGKRPLPSRYWFPEDHTSQVRERPARLTPDLAWLRPTPDRLGHFEFWLHTTFSLRRDGRTDEGRTAAFDFPRPSLALLRDVVRRELPSHLAGNGHHSTAEFLRPLEEFVLAQRLARAGLDGRLGASFPASRLLELSRATRRFVPRQVTHRWDLTDQYEAERSFVSNKLADERAARLYAAYQNDAAARRNRGGPLCDRASL